MAQGQVQQFASAPQPVGARTKYRPHDDTMGGSGNNMMHDRRVVRGNTHASTIVPQPDMAEVQKQRDAQRRRLQRANQTKKRPGTPEPVSGRKNMDIQTDSYLEELTERTVEFEAETQTDFLLDRPPSPLFMPAKIGVDTETQIEPGELFEFDCECEPVLEVLVGKTLEQSMMEVLEEEELESLRIHQEDFEKRRNAELLEVQRMEAAEKRRSDEMQRRVQQSTAQKQQDLSMMRKVVSRSIANAHLSSLRDRTLSHLLDAGVFAHTVQLAVDTTFMPNLLHMVSEQMQSKLQDRQIVASVMQKSVQESMDKQQVALEVEQRRIAAIDAAEREARTEKEKQRQQREAEEVRIQEEQSRMQEWEAIMPEVPEPQGDSELQIVEVKAEESVAVLANETTAAISEEQATQLVEALAALAEGQKVMATVAPVDEGEGVAVVGFRVAEAGEDGPADGEAAAAEGGE
mmetsp:Transcript_75884/g.195527  ORF Transcript_75884/g.195527 Transcript_75884/m.195527 type:complete len:461 (-) Transcript_75884:184-1566(-)